MASPERGRGRPSIPSGAGGPQAVGPVVAVEHLEKRYGGVVAVSDVSFEVEAGEIFGILGPNGSGKTTTVECLQGLRGFDAGSVRVLGFDPARQANELRRHIGAQLQESALPDRMKVWEALQLFASLRRGGLAWESVMDEWGLAEKRNAAFGSLSGGQQQRLFVALALVNAPKVVFLDEMTTGLDPASRRVAWGLIDRVREQGATVVMVTHFMDEAERLCDRVAVIHRKTVIATGSPAELVANIRGSGEVMFTTDDDVSFLHTVAGVGHVTREGHRVRVTGIGPLLAYVAAALVGRGIAPVDLEVRRPNLEDAYLDLTDGNRR
jgi:ABC-2 type transport system ATP-binding protein